jgi:hypothetical protein
MSVDLFNLALFYFLLDLLVYHVYINLIDILICTPPSYEYLIEMRGERRKQD